MTVNNHGQFINMNNYKVLQNSKGSNKKILQNINRAYALLMIIQIEIRSKGQCVK